MLQLLDNTRTRKSAATVAPAVPVVVSTTGLLADWDSMFSTLTTVDDGGGRTGVTQINDRVASAHLTKTTAPESALLKLDRQGRQYVQFNDQAWMAFTTAVNINYRSACVYFVGRPHRMAAGGSAVTDIVSFYQHTLGSHLNIAMSGGYPWVRVVTGVTTTSTPVSPATVGMVAAGNQLQVIVTRASGTQIKLWVNENATVPAGAAQNASQTIPGGEVGRQATTPAGLGGFDLYKILIYTSGMADSDVTGTVPGDPVLGGNIGKLMAYYNIGKITRTINLEGDSLGYSWVNPGTAGSYGNTSLIPSGDSFPVQIAVNCANNDVRFISSAVTGNRVPDLISRRDAAGGAWGTGFVAAWQNEVYFMIGTNDQFQASASGSPVWTTSPSTAARGDEAIDRANGMIALINTTTTGYLQRGANKVYVATQIARNDTGSNDMLAIDQMRTRITAGAFLTSCAANTGDTYAGKVVIESLHLWQVGGTAIFGAETAANDATYYYTTDHIHQARAGAYQRSLSAINGMGLTPA